MDTVGNRTFRHKIHIHPVGADGDLSADGRKVGFCGDLHSAFTHTANGDTHLPQATEIKILESRHGAAAHIGDVLVAVVHSVLAGLGKVGVGFQPLPGIAAIVTAHTVLAPQIAGDPGFVEALPSQRSAVEAAGGDLRLEESALRCPHQLLRTGLPGIGMAVGLTVVENVPVIANVQHTAVGIAQIV